MFDLDIFEEIVKEVAKKDNLIALLNGERSEVLNNEEYFEITSKDKTLRVEWEQVSDMISFNKEKPSELCIKKYKEVYTIEFREVVETPIIF